MQLETGGAHPLMSAQRSSTLVTYRALYPFPARNAAELSLEADCLIEVRHTQTHTNISSN